MLNGGTTAAAEAAPQDEWARLSNLPEGTEIEADFFADARVIVESTEGAKAERQVNCGDSVRGELVGVAPHALMVRVQRGETWRVLREDLARVATVTRRQDGLLNGVLWGALVGAAAFGFYTAAEDLDYRYELIVPIGAGVGSLGGLLAALASRTETLTIVYEAARSGEPAPSTRPVALETLMRFRCSSYADGLRQAMCRAAASAVIDR